MKIGTAFATVALSAILAGGALAQQTNTQPQHKPGLLSRLLHHNRTAGPAGAQVAPGHSGRMSGMMGHPGMGGMMGRSHMGGMMGRTGMGGMMSGSIIGNKRTHVYHMPGDNNLPAPQNRVYFRTVAQAQAAGYHASGSGGHGGRATAGWNRVQNPRMSGGH